MPNISRQVVHVFKQVVEEVVSLYTLLVRQALAAKLHDQHLAHHAQHADAERV